MARSTALALPEKIDRGSLGPAMTKLNRAQQDFVIAYWETGNQSEAVRRAGYKSDNVDTVKSQGTRLIHNPRVKAAIQEFAGSVLTASGTRKAVERLVELVGSADEKIALGAVKTLLDRTGIVGVTQHNVNVEVTLTQKEKVAKLAELATAAGLDPSTVLGTVVDVDFEEVDDAP